ncbi:ORF086 [Agrotis segetum granulovirus]|uniref:ORF086 n=1 Tax=Agrotis segetum granulosis virus TaxID=10464 RepID=Q6QXM6_GVAS|nr:vp39 [Agrotis segetum granulovirus]AAS82652.1 ORF086 [Agrotis segetum granulovirus]AHN92137.1 vp39 [Agrotis segetum granulovirus]AKN63374.1 vp39 [Agrotis segetum granulovirus]
MNFNSPACNLTNLCIFQGVQPPEFLNCRPYEPPCIQPYNDDGTFICQYHLAKYFKMEKMVVRIGSGVGPEFDMLIGKTLIQQNTEDARRIMIPLPSNFLTYLQVENMSATEKFVFYSIYERQDLIAELCRGLVSQEYYTDDVLAKLQSVVSHIMGLINPAIYCRPEIIRDIRSFDNPPGNGVQTAVFDQMPPFLKNLIRLTVRPQTMTVSNTQLLLAQVPTCDLVPERGLVAANLYNPTKSRFLANPLREPRFQVRTVVEFEGRATRRQEGLQGYEVYVVNRPLWLGTEVIP